MRHHNLSSAALLLSLGLAAGPGDLYADALDFYKSQVGLCRLFRIETGAKVDDGGRPVSNQLHALRLEVRLNVFSGQPVTNAQCKECLDCVVIWTLLRGDRHVAFERVLQLRILVQNGRGGRIVVSVITFAIRLETGPLFRAQHVSVRTLAATRACSLGEE